jgi:hypothetical protein
MSLNHNPCIRYHILLTILISKMIPSLLLYIALRYPGIRTKRRHFPHLTGLRPRIYLRSAFRCQTPRLCANIGQDVLAILLLQFLLPGHYPDGTNLQSPKCRPSGRAYHNRTTYTYVELTPLHHVVRGRSDMQVGGCRHTGTG